MASVQVPTSIQGFQETLEGEMARNGQIQKLMLFLASGRCYVSYTRIKTNDPSVELMVNSWLGVDRGRDAVIG